jgi:protein involved in polysaccharide export with SLBB domain
MRRSVLTSRTLVLIGCLFALLLGSVPSALAQIARGSQARLAQGANVVVDRPVDTSETPNVQVPDEPEQQRIRQRLKELETALRNKTRQDLIAQEKVTAAWSLGKTQVQQKLYRERLERPIETPLLDEPSIERKVDAQLARTDLLEAFGRNFFDQGADVGPSLDTVSAPSGYALGPGDSLKIIVWSEMGDETVYDVTVNPEGQVYIPILGVLGVAGFTVGQFEETVLGSLSGKFKHFKGQVTLTKIRTLQIFAAGEVVRPGAMSVSALATAFSALYRAGGPNERGSMRRIRVIRDNRTVREIDLYRYFLDGDKSQDVALANGDTIFVPPIASRVTVKGEVLRPGLFELAHEKTLGEILTMAGGLEPSAWGRRVKVFRWRQDRRRSIFDVPLDGTKKGWNAFRIENGDEILVERGLQDVANRVRIEGPVRRPGEYAVTGSLTVRGLIAKAGGVVPEVVAPGAGQIVRKLDQGREQLLSFQLDKALAGEEKHDLPISPLDVVTLFSQQEIEADTNMVNIAGAVRRPGEYLWRSGLRIGDLILRAQGLTADAADEIEIARATRSGRQSQIQKVSMREIMQNPQSPNNLTLQPLDRVMVFARGDSLLEPEIVFIKGEVRRPGPYALRSREETLAQLIERAGGLTGDAFPEGAVFLRNIDQVVLERQLEVADRVREEQNSRATLDLQADLIRSGVKMSDIGSSKGQLRLVELNQASIETTNEPGDADLLTAPSQAVTEQTTKFQETGMTMGSRRLREDMVRIPLPPEAFKLNGQDRVGVILRDGDTIQVPARPSTVTVAGAVVNPSTIMFVANKGVGHYIDRAGGFNSHAEHRRTVIVRANGEVVPLRRVRTISEGDIILVPPKHRRLPVNKLEETGKIAQILGNLAVMFKVVADTK